jgi:lipooligosaccharide transport system permease protein
VLANLNPLYHTVELVRHAAFGFQLPADLWHIAFLIGFAILTWRVAVWRMTLRLID